MPSLYNDPAVCEAVSGYCAELFGAGDVIELTGLSGTEDFTAVAEQIPAACSIWAWAALPKATPGGAHNPKMIVDESVLYRALPSMPTAPPATWTSTGTDPRSRPAPGTQRREQPSPYINRKAPDITPPGTFLPYLSLIKIPPVLPGRYFFCFSILPVTVSRRDGRGLRHRRCPPLPAPAIHRR